MVGVTGDPVDEYLARLRAGLRGSPERTRQILAEAEARMAWMLVRQRGTGERGPHAR